MVRPHINCKHAYSKFALRGLALGYRHHGGAPMLPYMYIAEVEHREWEHRFNERAARSEFVPYTEERDPDLIDVLRNGLSDLAHNSCIGVAAFSRWIRGLRGTATVPST